LDGLKNCQDWARKKEHKENAGIPFPPYDSFSLCGLLSYQGIPQR
jgi:hypothetical protein